MKLALATQHRGRQNWNWQCQHRGWQQKLKLAVQAQRVTKKETFANMSPLTTGCRQHQHQKQLLFLLLPPPVDIGFKSFRCHHHCPTMLPVPLPLDYFIVCARRHHRLIVASEQNFCCLSQYLQTSERKISALLSASVFNYFIITPNLDILLWQVLHHTKDYTGNPRLVRYQKTFPSYATPHTRSRQNDNYRHCPPEHWGHQHRTNWHKADRLNVFFW